MEQLWRGVYSWCQLNRELQTTSKFCPLPSVRSVKIRVRVRVLTLAPAKGDGFASKLHMIGHKCGLKLPRNVAKNRLSSLKIVGLLRLIASLIWGSLVTSNPKIDLRAPGAFAGLRTGF
jgi:hypothetical protein